MVVVDVDADIGAAAVLYLPVDYYYYYYSNFFLLLHLLLDYYFDSANLAMMAQKLDCYGWIWNFHIHPH